LTKADMKPSLTPCFSKNTSCTQYQSKQCSSYTELYIAAAAAAAAEAAGRHEAQLGAVLLKEHVLHTI
jgi:hypothetical protein